MPALANSFSLMWVSDSGDLSMHVEPITEDRQYNKGRPKAETNPNPRRNVSL
jgi:hypothetical protein